VEASQTPEIRECTTAALGDRDVTYSVERDGAVYRVMRYGRVVGYLVPAAWYEAHR
jgi:hypothetical protein